MTRPFRRLKGVSKEADQFAIANNRRPYVFGFTTEKGSTIIRDGSVPMGMDKELLVMWERLCQLSQATTIDDIKRLDKAKRRKS